MKDLILFILKYVVTTILAISLFNFTELALANTNHIIGGVAVRYLPMIILIVIAYSAFVITADKNVK